MSSNDLYSFVFSNDQISAVYEVSRNGSLELEDIDGDETYTLMDGYVVKTETEHGQTEYEIFEEDSATGYWREIAHGKGTVDSALLAEIASGTVAPTSDEEDDESDDDHGGHFGDDDDSSDTHTDEDDDDETEGPHSDDHGLSDDLYSFVLNDAGTDVLEMYEVENGVLDQETISDNESYTVSADYIVEVETYSYGSEWSVYQLDADTGYYSEVAVGQGTPDLTDIDALVASYEPGSYTRYDDDDSYDGSDDHDTHKGNENDNHLLGNGGRDRIHGRGGDDDMDGGEGKDRLFGGAGDDTIEGGDGHDMIKGGVGDDSVSGGAGNERLFGNKGRDHLSGDEGKDRIKGGAGDDVLDGGTEDDRLFGGAGNDTLTGGEGADRFVFKENEGDDVITDFEIGIDLIVLDTDVEESFADLSLSQSGSDAVLTYSGGTITLTDVDAASLTADSFDFG